MALFGKGFSEPRAYERHPSWSSSRKRRQSSFPAPPETTASRTGFTAGYSSNALRSARMKMSRFSAITLTPYSLTVFLIAS